MSTSSDLAFEPPPRRRAILDAALEVFADQGFHGAPVPPIASRAGVGVGTIYRYFKDKDALVNEVFRRTKAQLRDYIFAGVDWEGPPRQRYPAIGPVTLDGPVSSV